MVSGPFAGLIGHERVLGLLEREIAAPAHAYLLAGPSNVGKATVAHEFAAALLCKQAGRHDSPCSSCRRAASGNHPDLIAVEPDGRTALSVEQARATVAQAPMSPVEGDRKVFVFDEAGSMSEQAANALLKTLEEPTPSTVFVLVVESEDDLPATIASRCRTVQFGRVREETLIAALEERGIGAGQAGEAARISGGRPGLALGLATNPDVAAYRDVWLSVPVRVSPHPGEAFRLADEVLEAAEPLLKTLDARQTGEETDDLPPSTLKVLRERYERDRRREKRALHVTGLEILASWYADAASAQFGGPVRNHDIPAATLAMIRPDAAVANAERVLNAVTELQANQRPQLVFAALFAELTPAT
ncbi:MAG TPA: DNA polymerase III subunit [Acidimicrobiia bacterium]|nr:DNA polymerase III subunit [Acidimicrobiia bacterium]